MVVLGKAGVGYISTIHFSMRFSMMSFIDWGDRSDAGEYFSTVGLGCELCKVAVS